MTSASGFVQRKSGCRKIRVRDVLQFRQRARGQMRTMDGRVKLPIERPIPQRFVFPSVT